MNTPAHLIFGAAAFARPDAPRVTLAALLGSLLPDLSLYLLVLWSIGVMGIAPRVVFGEMYFSDGWQAIFAVDHSIILWGLLLAIALLLRRSFVTAFAGSGLLHAGVDFLLHHDDARRQFWPITDWVFRSPVSYWDGRYFGHFVAPLEVLACAALTLMLWRRFSGGVMRAILMALMVAEMVPAILFATMMH
jgi:membrane-bound metal-dependent hydrolase YbcI (DUF457 family)